MGRQKMRRKPVKKARRADLILSMRALFNWNKDENTSIACLLIWRKFWLVDSTGSGVLARHT
jgi:hypothetical protein